MESHTVQEIKSPGRIRSRKQRAEEPSLSEKTIYRADKAGKLKRTYLSNRRIGYTDANWNAASLNGGVA